MIKTNTQIKEKKQAEEITEQRGVSIHLSNEFLTKFEKAANCMELSFEALIKLSILAEVRYIKQNTVPELLDYYSAIQKSCKNEETTGLKIYKNMHLKKGFYDDESEKPVVAINEDLFEKLKGFCQIIGLSMDSFINSFMNKFIEMLKDQALVIIDEYIPIEQIENIYELLAKIDQIVDIDLKTYIQLRQKANIRRSEFDILEMKDENGEWHIL